MKKTMSIVATILILFGCDWKNQPETNKASSSPIPSILSSAKPTITPTKLPEPTVTPSFDGTGLDVYGKGIFCEKRENIKVKLDKPVSIAVTRDGSQVYVVNGKCGRKPYINDFGYYLESKFCREYKVPNESKKTYKDDIYMDVVENNPILTIKENGKINILYGDNSDFFYCSNDGIIATDESDYLYFSANRNVYKVNNDKQTEKVADLDELEKTNPNNFNKNGMIKGIVVKNHKIYLDISSSKIPERYKPQIFDENIERKVTAGGVYDSFNYNIIKETGNKKIRDVILIKIENNRYFSLFNIYNNNLLVNRPILNIINDSFNVDSLILIPLETNAKDNNIRSDIAQYLHNVLPWASENNNKEFYISDMEINSKGEIFLSFTNQHQIWKISPNKLPAELFSGYIKYFEETGYDKFETKEGFKNGKGTEALFSYPTGMAIDGQDNLYVADTGNNAIRKITPDGVVSTFYVEKGGN